MGWLLGNLGNLSKVVIVVFDRCIRGSSGVFASVYIYIRCPIEETIRNHGSFSQSGTQSPKV